MPSPRTHGFIKGSDTRKITRSQRSRRVRDKASDSEASSSARSRSVSRSWLGLLLEEGGYAVDDFGEGGARAEAGEGFEFIDARDAAHHVFEPGLVGFVVRDEFDGGHAVGALLHEVRESLDGDFFGVANVDDFADGMLGVDQTDERFDGVADVAEAARLFAVAINADGGVVDCGLHEIRQDHAVAASLPRTYGIEQSHD